MNWIFKKDIVKFSEDFETATISIVQRGNFRGNEGESVLILEKVDKEWMFTYLYKISKVLIRETDSDKKINIIELILIEKYKEEKLLSDYAYSIERIKNYNDLTRHFRRKYNKLSDLEFKAIEKDEIYYIRTVLGTIFNSLHSDHQEQFLIFLAENNPSLFLNANDLFTILILLIEYTNFSIIKPSKYLIESDNILRSIISNDEILKQVGFGNSDTEEEESIQRIHQQALQISNSLPVFENISFSNIDEISRFSEDLDKYKRLFKNSRLPFNLK